MIYRLPYRMVGGWMPPVRALLRPHGGFSLRYQGLVAVNRPCLEGEGISHLMIGADRCSCHRDRFVDQEIGDG